MDGFIEPETERQSCELVPLRNRLVHGDLAVEPTEAAVAFVIATAEETLNADLS